MSITASEARRKLFPLIEQVNDDRTVVEIVSRRGNAVLMSADDYAALEESAYLLRSPENVRRLLTAYADALEGRNLLERDLAELTALANDS
jgi:antitoxin YefM